MKHLGLELRHIFFNHLSGELKVTFGPIEKNLYFKEGELVFARTNQPGERLGEILFKLGKISEETFLRIEEYVIPHQNLGQVLLKKGLVSERNLREGLIYQIKEITLNLFNIFEANFLFEENKSYQSPIGEEIRIPTPQMIEDGIRLMKVHPKLVAFLEEKVPFIKNKTFLHVLTDEERELLTKITGKSSARALLKMSELTGDHFWRTLYLFYCLDLIDFFGEEVHWKKKEKEEKEAELSSDLNEILEIQTKIATLNYYEVLGIARNASEEEIKKAYFHLARRYHPDRFGREIDPAWRDKINDVFNSLTKAYKTLIDSDSRRKYDLTLAGAGEVEEKSSAAKAEIKFRQARTLFNRGRYEEAVILLEECVRLVPNKAEYRLLLAMAEAKIPALHKKAELDFLRVQELEPWNVEAYVGLGLLYKEEGLLIKASKQWQKALSIDPDHKIARLELGKIEISKKKKGFFSFFKKGK
ncbi:MAG: DnaJ domain-containing protein [Candidatus Aminicenantes bacterium]|nr:DnaJ domain-containing protein [Candidatus Aminicenantes bacterium]